MQSKARSRTQIIEIVKVKTVSLIPFFFVYMTNNKNTSALGLAINQMLQTKNALFPTASCFVHVASRLKHGCIVLEKRLRVKTQCTQPVSLEPLLRAHRLLFLWQCRCFERISWNRSSRAFSDLANFKHKSREDSANMCVSLPISFSL